MDSQTPPRSTQPAPLAGIRILDLSRLLPGPYCTALLADLGAEVIKIETPRIGDYLRFVPPALGFDGMFAVLNRNKKSVALNYRHVRGREVFLQLAQTAHVIVETFRPGAMTRWGIDAAAVHAVNPNLVYCSLSGYGQTGPLRDRAGHDLNYIALGGLLDLNGSSAGGPMLPGLQIGDLAGGMLAAISILAALLGSARSQGGRYLDVAMLDAVVSWMLPVAGGAFLHTGQVPERGRQPLAGGLPCYNVYATADGKFLTLAAMEPTLWSDFWVALNRPDLQTRQFDPTLTAELAALFKEKTRAAWLDCFAGKDVCVEPVNTFSETWDHPQVRHRGLAAPGAAAPIGPLFQFAAPEHVTPPPALGQHTRPILQQAGLTEETLQALEAARVIKTA